MKPEAIGEKRHTTLQLDKNAKSLTVLRYFKFYITSNKYACISIQSTPTILKTHIIINSDAPTTTALRLHRSLTVTKTNMYHLQDVTLETAQQIEIKRYPRKTCFLYKVRSDN